MRADTPLGVGVGAGASSHRVATRVTSYHSSTVDLRPARTVHIPELNACLASFPCKAVHFGYGVPVRLCRLPQPHDDHACLLLDPDAPLSDDALRYLLLHHPACRRAAAAVNKQHDTDESERLAQQVCCIAQELASSTSCNTSRRNSSVHLNGNAAVDPRLLEKRLIAALAEEADQLGSKSSSLSPTPSPSPPTMLATTKTAAAAAATATAKGAAPAKAPQSNNATEHTAMLDQLLRNQEGTQEDIAAIAKHISDHAEMLYQTWKARGLGPASIIGGGGGGANKGNKQQQQQQQQQQAKGAPSPSPPSNRLSPVDLLASPDLERSLEELVSSFVQEDKARLAGHRTPTNTPTTSVSTTPRSLPSSIQMALQKFEKGPAANQQQQQQQQQPQPQRASSPKAIATSKAQTMMTQENAIITPTPMWPANRGTSQQPAPTTVTSTAKISPKKSAKSQVFIQIPGDAVHESNKTSNKTKKQMREENTNTSGTSTWPLKNRQVSSLQTTTASAAAPNTNQQWSSTLPNQKSRAEAEVEREGEKLVRALRQGVVIAEDPLAPSDAGQLFRRAEEKKVTSPTSPQPQPQTQPQQQNVQVAKLRIDTTKSVDDSASWRGEWIPSRYALDEGGALTLAAGRKNTTRSSKPSSPSSSSDPSPPSSPSPLPHPELTSQQRQHLREMRSPGLPGTPGAGPVRPFLTRGSVAERVLLFERCPAEVKVPATSSNNDRKRTSHTRVQQTQGREREKVPGSAAASPSARTTLRRHSRNNSRNSALIPRFYYPHGRPSSPQQLDSQFQKLVAAFQVLPGNAAEKEHFGVIAKACDCPLYWKVPLYLASGGKKANTVHQEVFLDFWRKTTVACHDQASRLVHVLSHGQRQYLLAEDFVPLVQDVVDTHPGLAFLREANEFHSRYVHTVIARIFYSVNRSWSGKITVAEVRRSNLCQVVQMLEEEEDINQITDYFSYEHFYVIYCKFWELDKDHDLFIDRHDLARHNDHSLSSRMIDRIFSGSVTRSHPQKDDKMSYTEFVWFLISEEDKRHPTAIEYWFRCMDLDGDGYLSMYELEYFYLEQLQRMEELGIETLPYQDCLCQMLDMIRPAEKDKISLTDLKRCKMTPIFFDTFFNLEKYLDHEQKDPFASQRQHDGDGPELSDWDRYAAEEYEVLVAEEGGNDPQDELMLGERMDVEDDDFEDIENYPPEVAAVVQITTLPLPEKCQNFVTINDDPTDYGESDECEC